MSIISPLPFTLTNGTSADASQVMADLDQIRDDVNAAFNNGLPAPTIIPVQPKSAIYTTVLDDAGTVLLHPSADTTARTFTIGNASYLTGTVLTFVNQNGAGDLTISVASPYTMHMAVSGLTGDRTLFANGVATVLKLNATDWIISGAGLA